MPGGAEARVATSANSTVSSGQSSDGAANMSQLQSEAKRLTSTQAGATAKQSRRGKPGMSTMGLTPGTPMMAEIEASLEFYICQRLQKWRHLEFELSGARVQVS